MSPTKTIFAFALLALAASGASAEKADADKQAVIDYDTMSVNQVTQITTLTGRVKVTKGTLVLNSDKAVIKETPEGDMHVTLTSNAGKSSTFRQKRDGGPDLWVEGQAQRIEYDDRASVVKLYDNAQLRQLEGVRATHEIKAEFVSYDSLKEVFEARNEANSKGRGTLILAPRKPRPAAPAPGTP
ncbi:MAG: lipopolysaccharide transport periplasmic protein LptA [Pseudomonadota bacterium]